MKKNKEEKLNLPHPAMLGNKKMTKEQLRGLAKLINGHLENEKKENQANYLKVLGDMPKVETTITTSPCPKCGFTQEWKGNSYTGTFKKKELTNQFKALGWLFEDKNNRLEVFNEITKESYILRTSNNMKAIMFRRTDDYRWYEFKEILHIFNWQDIKKHKDGAKIIKMPMHEAIHKGLKFKHNNSHYFIENGELWHDGSPIDSEKVSKKELKELFSYANDIVEIISA